MDMHSDTQKHGLWNRFSNNVAAQVITTLVVAAISGPLRGGGGNSVGIAKIAKPTGSKL